MRWGRGGHSQNTVNERTFSINTFLIWFLHFQRGKNLGELLGCSGSERASHFSKRRILFLSVINENASIDYMSPISYREREIKKKNIYLF